MGETLEAGSEAETCLMAGRGMNGLRGVIVCFNASNGRYTLELDSGEMLSLRKRNVKAVADAQEEENEESKNEGDSMNGERSPSSLPRQPPTREETAPEPQQVPEHNMIDRFVFGVLQFVFGVLKSVTSLISNVTPTTIFVALLAVYWMWPRPKPDHTDSSSSARKVYGPHPTSYYHPDDDYVDDYYYRPAYYRRRRWYDWGWDYPYHGYYGWYGIAGLGSVLLLGVFVRKFGTNDGRRTFSWNRAWQRVMEMDIWELIRVAAICETALIFLRHAGGPRRR